MNHNQIPKKWLPFTVSFLKRYWIAYLIFTGVSLVWSATESIYPYFIKILIDRLSGLGADKSLTFEVAFWPLVLLGLIWTSFEACMRVQGYIRWKYFPMLRADIRNAVYNYVQSHSYAFFTSNYAGSIANKISDIPKSVEIVIESILIYFIGNIGYLIVSSVLLFNTSKFFFFLLAVWLVTHIIITSLFAKSCSKYATVHSESVSLLNGKIVDSITNILNVKLFANIGFERKYLEKYQNEEITASRRSTLQVEIMSLLLSINGTIFIIGTFVAMCYYFQQNLISLGDFSLIGMLNFGALGFVWHLTLQISDLYREIGIVNAGLSLINRPHEIRDQENATDLIVTEGKIEFQDVTFEYLRNANVFENKNVTIQGGSKVGLVGFSGSGKTTFVNLILRFFDIKGGKILIDNQDIAKVTQASLHKHIAVIPQDPILFHRTIMENIRYGNLNATDEEVIEASIKANCHEFILKLENGYETVAGERGAKLSGGQKQRIAIARAFLKNAQIIIMDEATSALDTVTERLIEDSLNILTKGKTTLIIAHRLSTLQNVPRLLVFNNGHIVEDGTFRALLKNKDGIFNRLWELQNQGVLPE